MKTLICDLNVYDNGHHIAFVNSILTHFRERRDVLFLFNEKAAELCTGIEDDPRVSLVPEEKLHPEEYGSLKAKFREYRFIEYFATTNGVGRVIFLEIDSYQVAIGLSRPLFQITGIYFRPFHQIPTRSGGLGKSFRSTLYHWKKRALFHVLKINKKVEPLFLLNDRAAGTRHPSWFRYLPDPIFDATGGAGHEAKDIDRSRSIRRQFGISPKAHILLAFGAMGARKNIPNIVAAYRQARFSNETVLLIAGKVRDDYRAEFDAATAGFVVNSDPGKRLIVFDEFIDEAQIDGYFRDAGTILLCYSKFYCSSGLMGKAAQHRKTCIVPDRGLLGDLNQEYELGYAIDPDDVAAIAGAMSRAERHPLPVQGFQRFVEDHAENAFLRTLLTA
jgi:glycosyltransferase involved in cell wall biosynthesis